MRGRTNTSTSFVHYGNGAGKKTLLFETRGQIFSPSRTGCTKFDMRGSGLGSWGPINVNHLLSARRSYIKQELRSEVENSLRDTRKWYSSPCRIQKKVPSKLPN